MKNEDTVGKHRALAKDLSDAIDSMSLCIKPGDVALHALMLNLDRALTAFLVEQGKSNQIWIETINRLVEGKVSLPVDLLERVISALDAVDGVFGMDGIDPEHGEAIEELRHYMSRSAS